MKRWFMTIPEACSLVLKAGGVGSNGKLYLLDMGDPVRIRDMAEQMIRFYGYEPEKDIKIEYIGTRPGERLDERLWGEDENPVQTEFNRILKVERLRKAVLDLEALTEKLKPICYFDPREAGAYRDTKSLYRVLREAIPSLNTLRRAGDSAKPEEAKSGVSRELVEAGEGKGARRHSKQK
jgi:FlaA1/EpsC-like NDP-sugar epimerase